MYYKISYLTGRDIKLTFKTSQFEIICDEKVSEIIEIKTIGGETLVKAGETTINLDHNSVIKRYHINLIKRLSENEFLLTESRLNKANYFVLPMMAMQINKEEILWSTDLYNVYIDEECRNIYIVYRFNNTKDYTDLEHKLTSKSYFVEILDKGEFTVFRLRCPDKFRYTIELFRQGKYSSYAPYIKKMVVKFNNDNDKIRRIIYRDAKLIRRLEHSLACDIPEGMDIVSKPDETEYFTYFLKMIGE